MGRGWHLTIDEWFYHWFDDEAKLPLVSALFDKIYQICDKITIQKGTRLARKFYELVDASSMYPPKSREEVKKITNLFIKNIEKVKWVDAVDDLQEELIPRLPRKDLYLVQICLQTHDKIIVTTDTTLYHNLLDTKPELGITVFMAEEFIHQYPEIPR
ncbi:hypothetical protein [Foetidibacter luteolus]|uniref:hypothetical protein n=1 Tax=Foetidibacter luteolus TaxID=2608880 RepID=UPI00129B2B79|nr:hypothetical protein [Foetidibacter luteolus]